MLFRVILKALLVATSASNENLPANPRFIFPMLLELPGSSPDPIVNELRPPASSDKAAEHPKPKSPFSDDVKEMLAPVNPHMDSIQMVKKQMTKQHANELLAKANLKAILEKPMDPAKAAELKDKMEAKEKSDKGKLAIPPIPPPKPPKDEDEGDGN